MSTDNELPPSPDEAQLTELFSVLKQVQPTMAGRVDNRATVATELARRQFDGLPAAKSGWKRTISVGLPFALGLGVGILATLIMTAQGVRIETDNRAPVIRTTPEDHRDAAPRQNLPAESSDDSSDDAPVVDRYFANIYLCGVGELSTTARYVIREKRK